MFLTVFTPTYNRGYVLERLYQSLRRQTCKDFEWLIIDDGSNDETEELVKKWFDEDKIIIRYIKKENGGKPSAYNVAVKETRGEYFTCVDSDDYLTDDAIEMIKNGWTTERRNDVIGHIYYRIDGTDTSQFITKYHGIQEYATLLDFYRLYGLKGDTMLVYKSDIVSKYQFPFFENEKFVPESYIYDLYDNEGVMHIYKKGIYIGEYLADGYTASMRKTNYDNPRGYEIFISNRLKKDTKLLDYFMDMIRYISIKFVLKEMNQVIPLSRKKWLTVVAIPFGWIFYKKVYSKYK